MEAEPTRWMEEVDEDDEVPDDEDDDARTTTSLTEEDLTSNEVQPPAMRYDDGLSRHNVIR